MGTSTKKIFFVSDTHFGTENIIKCCRRPFSSVEEMNVVMVDNWNSVVMPGDEVYHLGDLAFFRKDNDLPSFLKQLNGVKHLIKGNHDKYSRKLFRDSGFFDIIHTPLAFHGFLLSHEPVEFGSHRCQANIHGHIHDGRKEHFINGKNIYYNVSVEHHNYTPVAFDKILEYYGKQV